MAQCRTSDSRPTVLLPFSVLPRLATTSAETERPPFGTFGVSHAPGDAEPSFALVIRTDVGRSNKQAFRIPTAIGQFSQDSGGRALEECAFGFVHNGGGGRSDAWHVLQNEELRTASIRDVEDVEEEPGTLAVEPGAPSSN